MFCYNDCTVEVGENSEKPDYGDPPGGRWVGDRRLRKFNKKFDYP
jgi:hypothetical protein